jgi:hypothetical protein
MSSQPSNLFTLARSKLNLSVDSKDGFSLHRWVLLKNSIIQSLPLATPASSSSSAEAAYEDEEAGTDDETDSFMFPDAGKLVEGPATEVNASEAAWLDSLLETLGEDDDDDFNSDSDIRVSVVPVEDDEDQDDLPQSPPISPMSSSDDLTSQSYYPYLVPYPPFPPPLISYNFSPSSPPHYADPLPYCDLDDLDDLPPVLIEDTSDDESDAPVTPGQSLSSLSPDPASIPLPAEQSRLRHASPYIYSTTEEDDYFYPFHNDPLPFPDDLHPPLTYQEC